MKPTPTPWRDQERGSGWVAGLRRGHRDERGFSLPEVLVAAVIGALVMGGIASTVFTTTTLQRRTDDQTRFAAALAIASLQFDRDGAMAAATAPARSQLSAVACTTTLDTGLLEAGASVRYQAVAAASDGPYWLQRTNGAGTRTIARSVSACTWQARNDAGGRLALELSLTLAGASGETASQILRAAPRLW